MKTRGRFHAHLLLAWQSIHAAPLRTLLALTGVLIGVAAITLVFALGAAAQTEVTKAVNALGANMIMVYPAADVGVQGNGLAQRGRLAESDAKLLMSSANGLRAIAPQLRLQARLSSEGKHLDTTVIGVDRGYFQIVQPRFIEGAAFDDANSQGRIVILSSSVARKLFGESPCVGRVVRINRQDFQIAGVMKNVGGSVLGDHEDLALAPLTSARRRLGAGPSGAADAVDLIFAQFHPDVPLEEARHQVQTILRKRYRVQEGAIDPFTINTTEEFAKSSESIVGVLRFTLGAIASISLLVGGIGIMNVMLVSVTERTREIGLRLAVGALPRHIRQQFLVESALTCFTGGAMGAALAWLAAALASTLSGWAIVVTPDLLLGALLFSIVIGLLAGYLPAARAAQMDPVIALRRD